MATIPHLPTRNNLTFYATVDGLARQTAGGYLFQAEGTRSWRTVACTDPALLLLGRCDLADSQRQADAQARGFAALVCNPDWRLRREL